MIVKKLLIIVLLTVVLIACNTTVEEQHLFSGETPVIQQIYSGNNSLHPVIVKVFEQNSIYPTTIDIINNEYHSDYIYQSNFGAKIRYTVYIEFSNNTIKIKLRNIQQFSFRKVQWLNEHRLSNFNVEELPTKILNEIVQILNDQKQYNQVKNEIDSNFLFHYLVIKNLSKVDTERWIKNHMLPHLFNLTVNLTNFEENKTGKIVNKKYFAEFTNNSASHFNDNFVMNIYTNNNYSNIDVNTPLHINAQLINSANIASALIDASHVYLIEQ